MRNPCAISRAIVSIRVPSMPLGRALVRVSDAEHHRFIERLRRNLHRDRKSGLGIAARHRQRGRIRHAERIRADPPQDYFTRHVFGALDFFDGRFDASGRIEIRRTDQRIVIAHALEHFAPNECTAAHCTVVHR